MRCLREAERDKAEKIDAEALPTLRRCALLTRGKEESAQELTLADKMSEER